METGISVQVFLRWEFDFGIKYLGDIVWIGKRSAVLIINQYHYHRIHEYLTNGLRLPITEIQLIKPKR